MTKYVDIDSDEEFVNLNEAIHIAQKDILIWYFCNDQTIRTDHWSELFNIVDLSYGGWVINFGYIKDYTGEIYCRSIYHTDIPNV